MSENEGEFQGEVVHEKKSGLSMFLERGLGHPWLSEKSILVLLVALAFVLPVFFIPGQIVTVEFSKILLLGTTVVLGTIIWGAMCLRDGKAHVPKSILLLLSLFILLSFVVSAFFSPTPVLSFVGLGGEIGTVSSMLTLFLLLFLSSLVFRTRDRVLYLLASLLSAALLLSLYHGVRHIFGPILGFGIFTSDVASPVGKWNDFAAFMGLMVMIVISTLYFFSKNRQLRIPGFLLFVIGLFFLLLVDFTILWMVVFAVTAGFVVFAVYEGERDHGERVRTASPDAELPRSSRPGRVVGHIPKLAFILLLVSFVYGSGIAAIPLGQGGKSFAGYVAQTLKVPQYSEVVLTPGYTFGIAKSVLSENPILGSGPNRFSMSYLGAKTTDLNRTPFWDSTFDFGNGRVTTFFTTTGVLGMVFWFLFLVAMFYKLRKIFPLLTRDRVGAYLGTTLFILTIYLWSLAFFSLPNIAMFALSFLLTGALVAFLVGEGVLSEYEMKFKGSGLSAFVFTPVTIIVLIGALAAVVMTYQQTSSIIAFNEARVAAANGNFAVADTAISTAISRSDRDVYERFKSSLALVMLQTLAGETEMEREAALKEADRLVTVARSSAERAIVLDPTNFENHLALGGVFDTLAALGIQGAADAARPSYQKALELNPRSPRVLFLLARLELVAGNRATAKEYLYRAIEERPNFLEAVSALTQLELEDNKLEQAVAVVRAGVAAEPTNFLMRFALGYLYYASREYPSAIIEFESAVFLNPVYADAKYFLGLSYAQAGRKNDAILQFEGVAELNPENKDVSKILSNLKSGKEPFNQGIPTPTEPVDEALEGLKDEGKTAPAETAN